jgi:lycopene beta-cyclase
MGQFTYIVFELAWGLPVLAVQWAVGHVYLRRARRTLAFAVLVPTLYLSLADGVAISQGIWTLHSDRILGVRVGAVPVEEMVFFLLTNAMVAQSVILLHAWLFGRRATRDRSSTRCG